MKINTSIRCAFSVLLIVFCLSASNSFAQVFGTWTDQEKNSALLGLKKVFENVKKINIRLQKLETQGIEGLRQTQAELFSQIQEIQKEFPAFRGILEQTKLDLVQEIILIKKQVAEIQSEIKTQNQRQLEELKMLRGTIVTDLGQLRQEIKGDMDKLAELNRQSFDNLIKANSETLDKMAEQMAAQLNTQNQKITETIDLFRKELIPAIVRENKENLNTLMAKLSESEEKTLAELKSNREALINGIATVESKNAELIGILKKSSREQIASNKNIDEKLGEISKDQEDISSKLENNLKQIGLVGKNLDQTGKTLTGRSDQLGQKMDKSLKTLVGRSDVLDQKLDQSIVKIDQEIANAKLADEKITTMIGILQASADQSKRFEEKLGQSMEKTDQGQAKINLANEKLAKLIDILKTIAAAQGKIDQVIKEQGKTKEALADLRRKANVNISRNNDIKKQLKKLVSAPAQ